MTQTDLKRQIFLAPFVELIEKFHRIVKRLFDRIDAADKESHTLAALRDALLPKLISGELRVPNAADCEEGNLAAGATGVHVSDDEVVNSDITMTNVKLGRLESVELRAAWTSEAGAFTPWLAQEENIALLGEAIGLELEVEAQEKNVGPFRADILCKDTATEHWVLIENQLERTDHTHLGQLLTYASGLKAVTIVWIAQRFTEEHRAALDWLNEITDERFRFFGLEVELWRIGDSPPAPKFNIVCQPNDWSKDVKQGAKEIEGNLSSAQQLQLEFWTAFRDFVVERNSPIRPTKPQPATWISLSIGRSGFSLLAVASTWDQQSGSYDKHELRAELCMSVDAAKVFFAMLSREREQIEREFGGALIWDEQPGKKQSKIYVRRSADLYDRTIWPEYHGWLLKNLEDLDRVFRMRVKRLNAESHMAQDSAQA